MSEVMSGKGLFALEVLAVVAAVFALLLWLRAGTRGRRGEVAAALAERCGIVRVASTWLAMELEIDRPGLRGVLRAHAAGWRGFETIVFTGVTPAARAGWSITSRRYLPAPGPGKKVPLPSAALAERFVAFAERPEELLPFFDAEAEALLLALDAGLAHALVGKLAGIAVTVQGTETCVSVIGQQGDDAEHLTRVLELIHRAAQHGVTAAS